MRWCFGKWFSLAVAICFFNVEIFQAFRVRIPINRRVNEIFNISPLKDNLISPEFDLSQEILGNRTKNIKDNKKKDNAHMIARGILLSVSALYGTNFGCVKILEESLNPATASFLRFLVAAAVFSPQMMKTIKTNPTLLLGALEVGAYNAIAYWGQAESLLSTEASTVAFICSLAVVVVPLLDSVLSPEKPHGKLIQQLIPAALAVVGVACMELGGSSIPGFGDFYAFLQPFFFGLGFWRIEQHMKLSKNATESQAYTGGIMAVVAIMSLFWSGFDATHSSNTNILSYFVSQGHHVLDDWRIIPAILWTGIITTAFTSYGENVALKDLDAAESTVIFSTEPLFGTAFAAATLGESIGWNTIVGAVFILMGCAWSSLGGKIIGVLSTSTLVATEGVEEITENIGININQIIENYSVEQ